jgi:hypothetical protein
MYCLSQKLDARLLLFLNQLPVDKTIADLLLAALAQLPEDNLLFMKDVFNTWKRHAGKTAGETSIGNVRWEWAQQKIYVLPVKELPFVHNTHIVRFLRMLRNFAEKCTFSRMGDTFVKEALMVDFPPPELAALGYSEPPYQKAGNIFGESFNDTVQTLIRTTPNDRLVDTAWRTTHNAPDFAFIACVVWEMLGQEVLPQLLKNHQIVYEEHVRSPLPQLVVLEGRCGMRWSGTLFFPAANIEFPLLALLFLWVRCTALCGDTTCRSLQCAVETPSLLSARDPLYCLL